MYFASVYVYDADFGEERIARLISERDEFLPSDVVRATRCNNFDAADDFSATIDDAQHEVFQQLSDPVLAAKNSTVIEATQGGGRPLTILWIDWRRLVDPDFRERLLVALKSALENGLAAFYVIAALHTGDEGAELGDDRLIREICADFQKDSVLAEIFFCSETSRLAGAVGAGRTRGASFRIAQRSIPGADASSWREIAYFWPESRALAYTFGVRAEAPEREGLIQALRPLLAAGLRNVDVTAASNAEGYFHPDGIMGGVGCKAVDGEQGSSCCFLVNPQARRGYVWPSACSDERAPVATIVNQFHVATKRSERVLTQREPFRQAFAKGASDYWAQIEARAKEKFAQEVAFTVSADELERRLNSLRDEFCAKINANFSYERSVSASPYDESETPNERGFSLTRFAFPGLAFAISALLVSLKLTCGIQLSWSVVAGAAAPAFLLGVAGSTIVGLRRRALKKKFIEATRSVDRAAARALGLDAEDVCAKMRQEASDRLEEFFDIAQKAGRAKSAALARELAARVDETTERVWKNLYEQSFPPVKTSEALALACRRLLREALAQDKPATDDIKTLVSDFITTTLSKVVRETPTTAFFAPPFRDTPNYEELAPTENDVFLGGAYVRRRWADARYRLLFAPDLFPTEHGVLQRRLEKNDAVVAVVDVDLTPPVVEIDD